jgi:hypothetical protein
VQKLLVEEFSLIDKTLSHCRIKETLGQGGMGQVSFNEELT